jgi:2-dehydropantoate 2-reductase
MKHAILGAGAIGGLVGTALGSLGEDVTVIVRPDKLSTYPKMLTLERPSGTVTAPAHAVTDLGDAVDVLWIATRTFQLQAALDHVRAVPTHIVPLLNGVDHIAVLRSRYGHDRVIPATIAVEAERLAPGRFVQRSPVQLNVASSAEPFLGGVISRLCDLAFTCEFVENEKTLLWRKLTFLAPFALVTSASGKNKGEVFADSGWKDKLEAAVAEACAVAKADGAEIDAARLQSFFQGLPSGMRSSMAKDVAAGRQLELDAIAGPIVRGGERYGIPVPMTTELMGMVEARVRNGA